MIPIKYKAQTDEIIDRADLYGEFTNLFFLGHGNLTKKKMNEIENMFEDYVIAYHLLNKEEYISRLKAKVRRGYRMFLFDPIKATTEEEIEAHQDELWEA